MTAPSVYQAMAAVMADIGSVDKGGWNEKQGYAFRGIDQFMTAVHPAMVRHGVFVLPEVLSSETETRETRNGGLTTHRVLTVRYTFCGPAGDSVSAVTVGEAADPYDKAANKCLAAAYKYALMQVFCIPLESEQDADASSPDMGQLSRGKDEMLAAFKRLTDELDIGTAAARAAFVEACLGKPAKWSSLSATEKTELVERLEAISDGVMVLAKDNAGQLMMYPAGAEPFEIDGADKTGCSDDQEPVGVSAPSTPVDEGESADREAAGGDDQARPPGETAGPSSSSAPVPPKRGRK